ncbi:hypothetical protein N9F22_00040 [Alphaproteobacteria bacterium]|nr:hypothetical protein [Alphaproteobacteria bacterium]
MSRKLTTEQFIEIARTIHGDLYDYSKSIYSTGREPVVITCREHGDFTQVAYYHIQRSRPNGCKKCGIEKSRMGRINSAHSFEVFEQKARQKHGEKYQYIRETYKNTNTRLDLVCPIHGRFSMLVSVHLKGSGCSECSKEQMKQSKTGVALRTLDDLISQFRAAHGDKYDYSKVRLKLWNERVRIRCPDHGWFAQQVKLHSEGRGCKKCGYTETALKNRLGAGNLLQRFRDIHGEEFDYDFTNFETIRDKIKIKCPMHDWYEQVASDHLHYPGCPACKAETLSKIKSRQLSDFLKDARAIHGDKYDYSLCKGDEVGRLIKSTDGKITLICPQHGQFEIDPTQHIHSKNGCSRCVESAGEALISTVLSELQLEFEAQWKNHNLRDKRKLRFDFYVEEYRWAIEFNGKQHYEPIAFFDDNFGDGEIAFRNRVRRDKMKAKYCLENQISLSVIKYDEDIRIRLEEEFDKVSSIARNKSIS